MADPAGTASNLLKPARLSMKRTKSGTGPCKTILLDTFFFLKTRCPPSHSPRSPRSFPPWCWCRSLLPVQQMDAPPKATTWAKRNPQKSVQPVRTRRKLTDAEKAGQKVRRRIKAQENDALTADLEKYKQDYEEKLVELAQKYSCKPDRLRNLLNTSSVFRKSRKVNLRNALVHRKAREENAGERSVPIREYFAIIDG